MEPRKKIQVSFIMIIFSLFILNSWLLTTMSEVNHAAYNTTRRNLVITEYIFATCSESFQDIFILFVSRLLCFRAVQRVLQVVY